MNRFPGSELEWKLRILWGSFALDSWGMRIGKMLSMIVIIAFGIGATYFFKAIFDRLISLQDIGEPLLMRAIIITFVTLFAMLVVSNLITGIATMYRSAEIPFLLTRPISYRRVFLSQFTDNLAYSSWSLAVLGFPIVFAWGWVYDFSIFQTVFLTIFGLIPFVLIAAEVGVAALMALVFLARRASPRLVTLLVAVIILAVIVLTIRHRSSGLIFEGMARSSHIERYIGTLSAEAQVPLTPPHWLASAMVDMHRGNFRQVLFLCGLLTLTSIVWLRWIAIWAETAYYSSWSVFNEIFSRSGRSGKAKSAFRFTKGLLPNPLNAMFLKDILQFTRNPSQWGQFLILVAFLLVYLINLVYVSSKFNFDNPYWKALVVFLNFAFTGFILATLSVRFVFPLISLEGRGFWVVRSAPVSVNMLFWEKFFLAFAVFMILCQIIVFISSRVLEMPNVLLILTTVTIFLMGVALTGLAIGMGALFPDFEEESPMKIASTPGGVMTVIMSLVYVAVIVGIIGWAARGYSHGLLSMTERILKALIPVALIHALILLVPVRLGRHSIQKRDV